MPADRSTGGRCTAAVLDAMPAGVDAPATAPTIHTEVFGPEDGYPIVLAHGITCAIRVWANQITDLARDYRVIAYDHRGHGRSGVPTRRARTTAWTSWPPTSTPFWTPRWRRGSGP